MNTLTQEPPQKTAAPDLEIKDAQLIFNPANATTRATAAVLGTRAVITF